MFYTKELSTLKHKKILRQRRIFSKDCIYFASNDYINLSQNKKSLKKAYKLARNKNINSPRASMLINGYSILHQKLENKLSSINQFENCILVGSGFLANIALFESLCRNGDIIFIDEEYHASGILATKLINNRVVFFKHNDEFDLKNKLYSAIYGKNSRIIIAIEGVYSMSGNIAKKEFAQIAIDYNAILIVDEAHSAGTIGDNLLGYFDYYHIRNHQNFIKLGTLSKAYGSYGAYILSSNHINEYLQTRAKPIIYSTALSSFDTALALVNIKYIQKHKNKIIQKITSIKEIINKEFNIKLDSQIFSLKFQNQTDMIEKAKLLKRNNILVGAIRKPTTKMPILRIVFSYKHKKKDIQKLCKLLKE